MTCTTNGHTLPAPFVPCTLAIGPNPPDRVTALLESLEAADSSAEVMAGVYLELKRLAGVYLRRERADHTLQATALVHEAYLRLASQPASRWQDRAHFLAGAARIMRRILTDHARHHRALKRGAGRENLRYDDLQLSSCPERRQIRHLDEALIRLTSFAPRQAQVVELRFFGGMTEDEIAAHLGVCSRTVKRDWTIAKAWLHGELAS